MLALLPRENEAMPDATISPGGLYRYEQLSSGYVVYRDLFSKGISMDQRPSAIRAHQQATFLNEREAINYCAYRNWLTAQHGTDSLDHPMPWDVRPDPWP